MKCCYCKSWSMCFDEKPYYNECKSVCPLEEKEAELDNVSQGLAKDLAKDGDAISRQAAIEKIHWLGLDNDTAIMCDLAIRALSSVNPQEPSDISNDGTLTVNVEDGRKISRVLVCGANHWGGLYYPDEQEPETGHWEWLTEDKYRCSNCNHETRVDECMNKPMYDFCPFCGAKMESEKQA